MPNCLTEDKLKYISNVEPGTLVAFKTSENKAISAKVVNRSTKNRKLKLVTAYGKEYVVSFDDVLWVRTGSRWPRGVYEMLKGIHNDDKE